MNRLDVLFIKEGGAWTAQCLQYDIAAQGDTIKDAQRAFEYVLAVEAVYLSEKGKSLDSLPAAPRCYWETYSQSLEVESPRDPPARFPSQIASLLSTLLPAQRELRMAG